MLRGAFKYSNGSTRTEILERNTRVMHRGIGHVAYAHDITAVEIKPADFAIMSAGFAISALLNIPKVAGFFLYYLAIKIPESDHNSPTNPVCSRY